MRMSCNGCRILRKGCSDDCIIKPCLDWIKSPDAQANATLFLAKFYGRAGLINLIEAGPLHLRPAIFKSLLYEACGRIVDPISGSVGLLWSGKWEQCQAAVESVLRGSPITQNPYYSSSSTASSSTSSSINASPIISLAPFDHHPTPPPPPPPSPKLKFYDIRHVPKHHHHHQHHGSLSNTKPKTCRLKRSWNYTPKADHFSGSLSHLSREDESVFSIETVELSHVNSRNNPPQWSDNKNKCDVGLELTLGLSPSVNKLKD